MQAPDISDLLRRLQLQTVDGEPQAELDGRHFKLPPRLHQALTVLKEQGPEQGLDRLAQSWGMDRQTLQDELGQSLQKLTLGEAKQSYIHTGFTVLPAPLVQRLAAALLPLFKRAVVWGVLLATAWMLLDLFVFKQIGGPKLRRIDLDAMDWLLSYAFVFIVLMFHELGHATGLRAVGQQPQQIGFGFFLIFPVFYANVSNAWSVSRRSRFIVSLGGIYFQMLGAVLLYLGVGFSTGHTQAWLMLAFKSNLATAVFVLIPFIRNDGYWLLADWLGIHDLYQRAGGMCFIIWRGLIERRTITRQEWLIGLYAVGNYGFLLMVVFSLIKSLYLGFSQSGVVLRDQGWSNLLTQHPDLLVSTAIASLFFVLFASPLVRRAYQNVTQNSRAH